MLSKYVLPGDKVELMKYERAGINDEDAGAQKVYHSKVNEVVSDDCVEIMMPMEKTKLVLLSLEQEYEVIFNTRSGLFKCRAQVQDRYKTNNIYLVSLRILSGLKKHQRREFYRYSCAIEMEFRELLPEEQEAADKKQRLFVEEAPFSKGIMADISGGGIRFLAGEDYEPGKWVWCKCDLNLGGRTKSYYLCGEILFRDKLENKDAIYEYRIQFRNLDNTEREEIIRYIFEEERKSRQREKGV